MVQRVRNETAVTSVVQICLLWFKAVAVVQRLDSVQNAPKLRPQHGDVLHDGVPHEVVVDTHIVVGSVDHASRPSHATQRSGCAHGARAALSLRLPR